MMSTLVFVRGTARTRGRRVTPLTGSDGTGKGVAVRSDIVARVCNHSAEASFDDVTRGVIVKSLRSRA